MQAFIDEAIEHSQTHGTTELCTFNAGDIRGAVKTNRDYNLVVLGSIGPVLGSISGTLNAVTQCLSRPGYVLLDDGYNKGGVTTSMHDIPDRVQTIAEIEDSGFEILEEFVYDQEEIKSSDMKIFKNIKKRAIELAQRHPEQKAIFQKYIQDQIRGNYVLENEYVCVTWLLKLRIV